MEIIFGIHSILAALENPLRSSGKLNILESSPNFKQLSKDTSCEKITFKNKGEFTKKLQKICQERNIHFQMPPGGVFLEIESAPEPRLPEIYSTLETSGEMTILCLDQVTDIHNLAAIVRTSAFYGVEYLFTSIKNGLNFSPGFYRIASGGAEHLKIVNVPSMSRFLRRVGENDYKIIGFSEHASSDLGSFDFSAKKKCLVVGNEEQGLSHAVSRLLTDTVAIKGPGAIKSLNVSVATAIVLENAL